MEACGPSVNLPTLFGSCSLTTASFGDNLTCPIDVRAPIKFYPNNGESGGRRRTDAAHPVAPLTAVSIGKVTSFPPLPELVREASVMMTTVEREVGEDITSVWNDVNNRPPSIRLHIRKDEQTFMQ